MSRFCPKLGCPQHTALPLPCALPVGQPSSVAGNSAC